MRLGDNDIKGLQQAFNEVFVNGKMYVFGSRIDDDARGGDIDIYLIPDDYMSPATAFDKKISFLLKLHDLIGEQKIDVIIANGKLDTVEQQVPGNAVRLL